MRVAEQFIKQLQEGKTTEAIRTLKSSLYESTSEIIEETKQDVIASYGFKVNEGKKKKYNEDEEDMDDEEDEDEDDKEED
jgi:hypothetical protein